MKLGKCNNKVQEITDWITVELVHMATLNVDGGVDAIYSVAKWIHVKSLQKLPSNVDTFQRLQPL